MSAMTLATLPIDVYRSPALSGGKVTDQGAHLTGLLMITPLPVSSETFLAYTIQSPRRTWETVVYADQDNVLPDIDDGDKIHDTLHDKWYTVRGANPWERPEGDSFIALLIDELKVTT